MIEDDLMNIAIEQSRENSKNNYNDGGPFGAIIIKDGKIIAKAHNTVLKSQDPTAHAEVNVIREACVNLGTHDLSDCILYTSCYPCPMCLGAIVWSNIKEVYYGNTKEDAASIGFRDDMIYQFLDDLKNNRNSNVIKLEQINRDNAIKVFEEFNNLKNKNMY